MSLNLNDNGDTEGLGVDNLDLGSDTPYLKSLYDVIADLRDEYATGD